MSSAPVDRSDYVLGRTVLFGWGIGTLAPVIILTATNVLLLRFMTDYVGIAAGVAASLIAFAKILDAFADPMMGVISDRTETKWGRRRPYLMIGGLLLALSTIGLFTVPAFESDQARTLYMGGALLFYALAYTVFNIPYLSMPAEMTGSYHERSYLMSFRVYAVGASQIAVSFGGYMLIAKLGGGAGGHFAMAICLAVIILAASIACFCMTAKAPFTLREKHVIYPLRDQIRSVASNKPFFILILCKFLTLMSLGTQAVFPFFFSRILGISDSYLGYYFLTSSLLLILSQPLWLWLGRRFGKRNTFMLALFMSAPAWLSWLLASHGEPIILVFVRAVVIGVAGGGAILMGQSMLPDTMEYDYRRTGLRREGIFAGFYTTVEKLSGAIGIAVVGAFLSAAGYVQSRGVAVDQPPSAITAIYISIACVPALISLAAAFSLFAYDLSESRLKGAEPPADPVSPAETSAAILEPPRA